MRPPHTPSFARSLARQPIRSQTLEHRGPGKWFFVGDDGGATAFETGISNIGGSEVLTSYRQTLGAGPELRLAITGASFGDKIFQLPTGFRPDAIRRTDAQDELGGFVAVTIKTDGWVYWGFVA